MKTEGKMQTADYRLFKYISTVLSVSFSLSTSNRKANRNVPVSLFMVSSE